MDPLRNGGPRQIGPYRLIGHLGSGGMGRVFLARSRGGRAVAVKVVHAELAGDAEFRRRFAEEVTAARRVGGFYTAQVVDADPDADPPWLATAYILGPSLAEAVTAHGRLPASAVRVLGAGLAEGLAAIHASGLVHRDLTHRNVILADDGPRVIDFGIAKALDAVHASTRIIGTPGFMSPEQARAGRIGPESDVFSLGCVLAYAATGIGPFGGGRADLIVYRIVHEEPNLDGIPADIAPLLRSCLAKAPADRPKLEDILDQLEAPAADATRWLPPGITAMISERGTVIRTSTWSSAPEPPDPTGGETGGSVHGDRANHDAGKADPRRPSAEAEPADGRAGAKPPHPGHPMEGPMAATRHGGGTATAAITLALLCIPGLMVMIFKAAEMFLRFPGEPFGFLMLANLAVSVAEAIVLAMGARLLSQRNASGRRMIAISGGTLALHGTSAIVQFFATGGELTVDTPASVIVPLFVASPLTAVSAAAALLMAVLPSTGRWCLRRS
ncbi:serine/threonine-protein kinase [Nonomuraea sp. NPDC050691]|uniref:serine/threonine-protein kinase n=1 Tax=Nonomuraea sp. NPDC050691 TaxID=3155661 RepID=UPI0033C56A0E